MFKTIHLFTISGVKVRIHFSWFLLAFLVTWSMATGLFPRLYSGGTTFSYWLMGLAGALGLFASIVFHEFWHSIVGRMYGMNFAGITLFVFGGVAEMKNEPPTAKSEFFTAIAGPISSLVLGCIFLVLSGMTSKWGLESTTAVMDCLGLLNFIMMIFNIIPAFPLDGGRVLRSILWGITGNLKHSTFIPSTIGSIFGMFLVIQGVLWVLGGLFVSGIWLILVGLFLRRIAIASYEHVLHQDLMSKLSQLLPPEVLTKFLGAESHRDS
jgi:Zn-dependent protease